MHLIQLIEKEIRTKQISQRTLARMVGVSNGTISNILVGHVPVSTKILDKFASYFGVSVGELRGESISAVRESQAPYYLSPRMGMVTSWDWTCSAAPHRVWMAIHCGVHHSGPATLVGCHCGGDAGRGIGQGIEAGAEICEADLTGSFERSLQWGRASQ